MNEVYANTKKQTLGQHLFGVGVVAKEIMKTFCSDKQLHKASFIAGCWHDIGKLEIHFQDWLNKELKKKNLILDLPDNGVHIESGTFSWEKYPTHNEVSVLIYELLADSKLDKANEKAIKHAIYWHHAKPIRKDDITMLFSVLDKLKDNDLKTLLSKSKEVINEVIKITDNYFDNKMLGIKKKSGDIDSIEGIKLPAYKTYANSIGSDNLSTYQDDIKKNAKENLIRTAVISADRLISSLSSDELEKHIKNKSLESIATKQLAIDKGLNKHITHCLESFNMRYPNSDRNKNQKEVASKLIDKELNIAVLNGPAGCGKTKIALEWAKNINAKQIIWVCPRVAIAQSLFKDLSSDEYLPNANIEIHTGELKYTNHKNEDEITQDDYFKGDIVLTTIDQIINSITTHRNIVTLAKFMNATVIFDEFHEYAPMAGFNILFAELIECKKMQQDEEMLPNTLLVSATPNYYFVENFLNILNIQEMSSFNNKPYKIEFVNYDETSEDENNPLYQKVDKNTFVISNTAITAQKSFIKNQEQENSLLVHSKFTPQDRQEIFTKVIDSFKENGKHNFDIVRSGPVIQAALNISCKNMISEMSCAENILQRIGRLNRFGEFDNSSLKIALTENIDGGRLKGVANFLNRNFQFQSTKVWISFLRNKVENNKDITISDLYAWYKEFYTIDSHIKMIEQDFITSLKNSVKVIGNNIFEPVKIKLLKNSNIKLKKHSLRGNSRFVQMAIYDVKNNIVLNEYLIEPITLGINEITNYGDDDNALEFMGKKHHNIKKNDNKKYGVTKTTKYKTKLYIKNSRDPQTPIYVSYIPYDLSKISAIADNEAIYYLKGVKQSIGIISISKIIKNIKVATYVVVK